MNVKKIIEEYKNNYRNHSITDEFTEKINSISIDDYEKYYFDLYENEFKYEILEITNGEKNKESNLFEFLKNKNKILLNTLLDFAFDNNKCIIEEETINEFKNFFINLNKSPMLKDMLDEDSEHRPLENGDKLESILGSVINFKLYEEIESTAIEMYAFLWLRINVGHPFTNGNKRTSFLGVKTLILDKLLMRVLADSLFLISSDEKKLDIILDSKSINPDEKEKKLISFDQFMSFLNNAETDLTDEIKIKIDEIMEFVQEKIYEITNNSIHEDYILSIFIAKTKSEEYSNNNRILEKRYIEIIKSNIIINILMEFNGIVEGIGSMIERLLIN